MTFRCLSLRNCSDILVGRGNVFVFRLVVGNVELDSSKDLGLGLLH